MLTQNWYDENQTWQGTPGGTGPTGTAICGTPDIPGVAYLLPLSDSTLTPSRKTLGTDHWALHSVALLNQIMETRLRKPTVPAPPLPNLRGLHRPPITYDRWPSPFLPRPEEAAGTGPTVGCTPFHVIPLPYLEGINVVKGGGRKWNKTM